MVEIHPDDGKTYGIADGDPVKVTSPAGEMKGTAVYSITGNPGIVYIYHGNKKGEANNLIDRNYLDPYTGFPGYKSYFYKIEKQAEVKGNAVSIEV